VYWNISCRKWTHNFTHASASSLQTWPISSSHILPPVSANSLNQKVGHTFFESCNNFWLEIQISFSAIICPLSCHLQHKWACVLLEGMWCEDRWCWSVAHAMRGRTWATDSVYATWNILTFGKSTNRLMSTKSLLYTLVPASYVMCETSRFDKTHSEGWFIIDLD
jgi:hypothetical protein